MFYETDLLQQSWSLCTTDKVFSKCFCLLSINLGTWFSSKLHFGDELCFIGFSSITESMHTFDKSSTRLLSFDEIEFIDTDDYDDDGGDDDDDEADEVALLLDDSCSSLNESASVPKDKVSLDAEPPHIWVDLSKCSNTIFPLPLLVAATTRLLLKSRVVTPKFKVSLFGFILDSLDAV